MNNNTLKDPLDAGADFNINTGAIFSSNLFNKALYHITYTMDYIDSSVGNIGKYLKQVSTSGFNNQSKML
jgi:hypothetical protein